MTTHRTTVLVTTSVKAAPLAVLATTRWHGSEFRCRAAVLLYRIAGWIGRIADRIDAPGRHLR